MRAAPLLAVLATSSIASSAAAAEPDAKSSMASALGFDARRLHVGLGDVGVLALPGDFQVMFGHFSPIDIGPVDAALDDSIPAENATYTRLRLSPLLIIATPDSSVFSLYRIGAELDVVRDWIAVGQDRGILGADPRARTDTGLVGQRLSQLYAQAGGPYVAVQVGLVRSRWGMGLVSNGGDDPVLTDTSSPFGYSLQGDHVVRIGAQMTPLGPAPGGDASATPLAASIAVDGVIDDDTALWSDGDRAYQVVAAVSGRAGMFRGGLYFAHRWQAHHEGGDTTVNVIDGTLKLMLAEEADLKVSLEAEVATIRGRSSLTQSVTHPGSFDVDQLGGVLRVAVQSGSFLGVIEAGAASADDNPFDDELRAFSFDRDYRVGLVLFRELLRANAAVGAYNAADPAYRGEPTRGYERIATQGAVRGATYVNPRVTVGLLDERLHLMAGFLYAQSDGAYVDPFWSGVVGGMARGPRNGPSSRDLGWELDLGASLALDFGPVGLRFRLEGAFGRPGTVFDNARGESAASLWGLWAHVGVVW